MQALVWLCLALIRAAWFGMVWFGVVWFGVVWFGTSFANFKWLRIFKCEICGRNFILHWSKYGICWHYGHVCCVFSKARCNLQILSEMAWPVADGQYYLISGNIFFFHMERFQCVSIVESKSVPLSALIQWIEDPGVLFEENMQAIPCTWWEEVSKVTQFFCLFQEDEFQGSY